MESMERVSLKMAPATNCSSASTFGALKLCANTHYVNFSIRLYSVLSHVMDVTKLTVNYSSGSWQTIVTRDLTTWPSHVPSRDLAHLSFAGSSRYTAAILYADDDPSVSFTDRLHRQHVYMDTQHSPSQSETETDDRQTMNCHWTQLDLVAHHQPQPARLTHYSRQIAHRADHRGYTSSCSTKWCRYHTSHLR